MPWVDIRLESRYFDAQILGKGGLDVVLAQLVDGLADVQRIAQRHLLTVPANTLWLLVTNLCLAVLSSVL